VSRPRQAELRSGTDAEMADRQALPEVHKSMSDVLMLAMVSVVMIAIVVSSAF
jgi:hypothetical protein